MGLKAIEAISRLSIVFGNLRFSSKQDEQTIQRADTMQTSKAVIAPVTKSFNMPNTYVLRLLHIRELSFLYRVEKVIDHNTRKLKNRSF